MAREASPGMRARVLIGVMAGTVLAVGCAERPPREATGAALFETCVPCHGADGAGIEEFQAPAIAGLPEWYLLRQLENFHEGRRGAHADDANGLRMRGMIRTLNHEGDIALVAAHVAAMPAPSPAPTQGGDAEAGRAAYEACVQCHGADAAGDPAQNAPPLTHLNDWYIVAQLDLFKAGIRGTTPGDTTGAAMRPMALGFADETSMANVAAYIASLRGN